MPAILTLMKDFGQGITAFVRGFFATTSILVSTIVGFLLWTGGTLILCFMGLLVRKVLSEKVTPIEAVPNILVWPLSREFYLTALAALVTCLCFTRLGSSDGGTFRAFKGLSPQEQRFALELNGKDMDWFIHLPHRRREIIMERELELKTALLDVVENLLDEVDDRSDEAVDDKARDVEMVGDGPDGDSPSKVLERNKKPSGERGSRKSGIEAIW